MNLLELQESYNEKQKFIKWKIEEIKTIEYKMENIKAVNIKDITIQGRSRRTDLSDLLNKKVILENQVNDLEQEISRLTPIIKELEELYQMVGDRDKQIYIQRKIWGYSPLKVAMNFNLKDESSVRKICKKVEKKLEIPVFSR